MAAEESEEGGGEAAPKRKLDPQLLFILGNTLLTLGAVGTLVYTKLIWERPPIFEEEEIKKKEAEVKKPVVTADKIVVAFDQMIVNLALTTGKAHYATVAFAIECRDDQIAELIKKRKAMFVDKVISALSKRQMTELNTIQGKLLLKSELMREFNTISSKANGVTDMYFSNFILQ